MLAAEAAYAALRAGDSAAADAALAGYDERACAASAGLARAASRSATCARPSAAASSWAALLASLMTVSRGRLPAGPLPDRARRRADADRRPTGAARLPRPRTARCTFDKLSSVFASGNTTRDDQPSHIRLETSVPPPLGELWQAMCPAQVYELLDRGRASWRRCR